MSRGSPFPFSFGGLLGGGAVPDVQVPDGLPVSGGQGSPLVDAFLALQGKRIKDAVTAPRDAYTGDLQVLGADGHPTDEAMERAGGLAGLAMTGSLPFSAPAGALRTFGGRAAATADHAALDRAATMQAAGTGPDAIWRDTGWGLGRDGAARFEIPDDAARLRPHDGSPSTTLGQVLDHPALFEAYPGLRDVSVLHRPELGADAAANPARNWIALNLDDPQALESLLHEGQHLVQRREGFAPGASPIDPALAAHPRVAEVAALRQRLAGIGDPAAMALADRTDQAVRLDAYRTAAGEVEARNVEGRRAMSPAERAAAPPWQTQDIPSDRQWVPTGRGDAVTGDGAQLRVAAPPSTVTPQRTRILDALGFTGATTAGAIAASPAIAGDAQPLSVPVTPRGAPPVSFGSAPFGFGPILIPNASPDDARTMLRRAPFDPADAPDLVRTLLGGSATLPRDAQVGPGMIDPAQASPQTAGPLDLNGPAGALVHQPGARLTAGGPPVGFADDEAGTQALERQTGMVPGGAPPGPSGIRSFGALAPLFDRAPMGAPQAFSGTSGTIVPQDGAPGLGDAPTGLASRPVPLPPQRPDDLSAESTIPQAPAAVRPLTFGRLPSAAPAPSVAQAPVATGSLPASDAPAAVAAAPAAAPGVARAPAPEAEKPLGDRIGAAFDRFNANGGNDLMLSLAQGLLSTPGFGRGIGAGLKIYQDGEGKRAATRLAEGEYALKVQKAVQEATGLKGNQAFIKAAFPDLTPEQVVGGASNSTLVSAAIAKMQNRNAGREMKADSSGVNRWVDTGEPVFKDDEGKADWAQVQTPDGGTMLYSKSDPTKTQMLVPGQPARPATAEERAAYGIQPGQGVKMTAKDGPVPVGGANNPQVKTFELRDGTKVERQWDPTTNTWADPNYGANPPTAQAPTNPYATGKFNEGQGKAAGFADRMMGSEPIIRQMEGVGQNVAGGMLGRLPNTLKTEDRQRMEQAQRDFVSSILRKESGAAIAQSEFDNAAKQYFPQPGDTDAVVAQKRVNRQRAIESIGREAGPAYAPSRRFDETGNIVPSMAAGDRFKQLRSGGLSKADAYARMHQEGY